MIITTENLISGAAIWRKNRGITEWLVVKEKNINEWELPKGDVRRGESSVGAIIRVLREDTGIAARVLEEAGRVSLSLQKNGQKKSGHAIFYLANQVARLSHPRILEERWLPLTSACRLIKKAKEKKILKQANSVFREWKKQKKE